MWPVVACRVEEGRKSRRRRWYILNTGIPYYSNMYSGGGKFENLVITTKIENFQLPSAIPHADNHNAPTVMQYCRMLIQ